MPVLTVDKKLPLLTLGDYLSQKRSLVVPQWQREYSWSTAEDREIDTLLKDLLKFARDENSKEYLMGSVVLCEPNANSPKPLLIDGQQRTITLSLLLMCINRYLTMNNLINGADIADTALRTKLNECINANLHGQFKARVEMKQSNADVTLSALYEWASSAVEGDPLFFKNLEKKADTQTQKNLIEATSEIYKTIDGGTKVINGAKTKVQGSWLQQDEIKAGILKILDGVKFIQISVDSQRESIAVFDRINNRGLGLSGADLVKNLMFAEVSEKEFSQISDSWNDMSELLMKNKKSRLQDPRYLLRSISHLMYGAHESYDDLDQFWLKKFEENKVDKASGISPIEFSKLLPKYAQMLQQFVNRSHPSHGSISEIFLLGEMGSIQHYSVLLAGADIESKDSFHFLARQVNLRTLLYILGRGRTQEFDLMIPKWAHAVYKLGPKATKSQLTQVYKDFATPKEEDFQKLSSEMDKWDYLVSSELKRIRAVLAFLSSELNSLCNIPIKFEDTMRTRKIKGEAHAWEVEHIQPKSIPNNLPVNSIGNLVLLAPPDNRDLSNKEPSVKVKHYEKCSLQITSLVSGQENYNKIFDGKIAKLLQSLEVNPKSWDLSEWNEQAIDARKGFYFKYLSQLIQSAEK
jgi:hypothetical protein